MATGEIKDGDVRFSRGMDSVSDAKTLPEESYIFSENMLNRGGAMQPRPGYDHRFTLPPGQLQALVTYTPRVGDQSLVALVSGVAYSSVYPFTDYREIEGAHLSASAKQVFDAATTKAVSRNADGSLTLQAPQSLLMLQDGINPCIYFDGQKTAVATGVPQGTHMAWSGARLWVARREQLYAGDIADPLSFFETTYNTLGGSNYFILPGLCTGLAPLPSSSAVKSPLLAYTNTTTTMFRSNILARASWPTIEDFQSDLFTTIGCVAPRSIVSHAGMLWWFTDFGLVKLDSASNSYITSKIDFIDREMIRSGQSLYSDLSGIASANYENFLMHSVPSASKKNRHTWVYDGSTNDLKDQEFPSAWASVWTGINPVQWASIKGKDQSRLFVASSDDDGQNRVYEVFTPEKRDNGCDIPWAFESRSYTGGTLQKKHFRFLEYALSELSGQVDMRISWAGGNRGRWKAIATPTFFAREGNIEADTIYSLTDVLFGLKKQSRVERTQDVRDMPEDSLSSAGVEGQIFSVEAEKEAIDSSFAIRLEGSGPVAIRAIRLFMDLEQEPDSGMQDNTELDDHFVRFDGAASKEETALQAAPETFTASATQTARYHNATATATATIISSVSQSDATKRANQVARARAEERLREIVPAYVGGSLV